MSAAVAMDLITDFLAVRPHLDRKPARDCAGLCHWLEYADLVVGVLHVAACPNGHAGLFSPAGAHAPVTLEAAAVTWPPLEPLSAVDAEAVGTRLGVLGGHVVPLKAGLKRPSVSGYHDTDSVSLTPGQAAEHATAGGNLAVHLGRSRWIVFDAEDAVGAAVAAQVAGVADVLPANAQVVGSPKHGGSHTIRRVPDDVDWDLVTTMMRVTDADGHTGRIEVLAGARIAVTLGSWLGRGPRYRPFAGSPFDPSVPLTDIPEAPRWLFDRDAPCPPLAEPLRGALAPETPYERLERSSGSDELTAQIDAISWEDWLAGDPRLTATDVYDGRCGCPEYYFNGADGRRSATLHDGCELGNGAHVWSGTMRLELGLQSRSGPREDWHGSRLDLATALAGPDVSLHEVAARVGIELRSSNGPVSLLGWLDDAADAAEDAGDAEAAARHRAQAAAMRAAPKRVKGLGAVPAAASVAGVDRFTVAGAAPGVAGPPAESTDEVIEAELVDDDPVGLAERKVLRETRSAVAEIERQLRGAVDPNTKLWQGMTPGLGRIANFAESRGVYLHGLVAALLPRILAAVPPNVVLPPANRLCEHKAEGQGVNCYAINIAASSAGKGRTDDAAVAAIPLPDGVIEDGTGTSEHWSKLLRGKRDGTPYIKATSLLLNVDEMDTLNGFLSQPGNKMPGWLASTFMNGRGGQGTSDEKNSAVLPRHGSRIGILINAQYSKMDTLAALDGLGVGARFVKGMPGVVAHEDRGNLYGVRVPAVLADQSAQPWFTRGHVGEPACAAQQSPAWLAANRAAPTLAAPDAGAERVGVTGFDDAPPLWVELPETAWADIAAGEGVAAARAADLELAFDQDQEGLVSGHRILVRERVAFALAVLDGERAISEEHWEAAGVFLVGSDIVTAACAAWLELSGEAAAFKAGALKGIGYAASKAAESTVTTRGVQSSMRAIVSRLQKAGGAAKPGYLSTGVKGKFSGMSTAQKRHMEQAFQVLERAGQVALAADGSWVLRGSLAVTAPPAA